MVEELSKIMMRPEVSPGEYSASREDDFPTWFRLFALRPSTNRIIMIAASILLGAAGLGYVMINHPSVTAAGLSEDAKNLQAIETMETNQVINLIDNVNQDINQELANASDSLSGSKPKNGGVLMQATGDTGLTTDGYPTPDTAAQSIATATSPTSSSGGARPDPFEPLINPNPLPEPPPGETTSANEPPPVIERDILDDIEFVGLVDEKKTTNNVAVLKVNDPINGKLSMVRKLKEAFILDGHKIYIKSINRYQIGLWIDGKVRYKSMNPLADSPNQQIADSNQGFGTPAPSTPSISPQVSEILKALQDH